MQRRSLLLAASALCAEALLPRREALAQPKPAPKPAARPGDFVAPAGLGRVGGAYLAGDQLVLVAEGAVAVLERGGAHFQAPLPVTRDAGVAIDPSGAIHAFGDEGRITRVEKTGSETFLAPALEAERIVGVVVDGAKVVAVGIDRAVYVRSGDTWSILRYPAAGLGAMAVGRAADGTVHILGRSGRVVSLAGGKLAETSLKGLPNLPTFPGAAWHSPRSGKFWAVGGDFVYQIDPRAGSVQAHRSATFFDTQTVTGAALAQGDLLVVSTSMSEQALFDGTSFYKIDDMKAGGGAAALDAKTATVYRGGYDGLQSVRVKHEWLGTGKGDVLPVR